MTAGVQLVVFDLAGTTVRDDGVVEAAFEDALDELGLTPTEAQRRLVAETMGQSKIAVFRALLGDEELARRANRAFEEAFSRRLAAGEVTPVPGADDALDAVRRAGARVCFTTGFSDRTREAILEHLGWSARSDLALSPGGDLRGRPAPDLVLAAVIRLGVDDVREVVVVGDTVNDLLSGTRAGAGRVVGVLTGAHDRATLARAPHTDLIESVAELPQLLGLV